ncbi:Hypothetical predicted protein [Olea europaea subsp. europaea]|uniref:Uncharacterized protein n=1 Tax=Olea europaea subsp. europaea TaxID=158383 RepID=A0A8S0SM73_OLEEU|nr:Hypothetical predicted protein [Olea europaea subsp. europaea]
MEVNYIHWKGPSCSAELGHLSHGMLSDSSRFRQDVNIMPDSPPARSEKDLLLMFLDTFK